MPEIRIAQLSKSFRPGHDVVHDLSLSIPSGEFLSVVGPSGSGKTTLLRLLAGLETPTAGTIHFGDRRVDRSTPRERGVAVVFQNPAPYPHLRVRENIAFSLRASERDRTEVRRRVDASAEFLGITGLLNRRPDELSGGERQRVVLARAIARRPALLLLDEPLTGLDAPLREDVRRILSSIHREHALTILMVTHDQADALALGDRVAVLDRGVLQQCDAPEVLYNRPATAFVARFIGDPPMSIFPARRDHGPGPIHVTLIDTEVPVVLPIPEVEHADREAETFHAGFRPEAMRLIEDCASGDLPATVERVEQAGRDQVVWLLSKNQRLTIRAPLIHKVRPGDRLSVRFDVSRMYRFAAETGAALPAFSTEPRDPRHGTFH